MTAGAVAIAYNILKFEGDLRLSRNALEGIFEGQIKNWDDPQIAKTVLNQSVMTGSRLPFRCFA